MLPRAATEAAPPATIDPDGDGFAPPWATIPELAPGEQRLTLHGITWEQTGRARRDRPYVRRLTVDGRSHDRPWLRLRDLRRDATMRFALGETPTAWGTRPDGAPPSYPPDASVACDAP